MEIPIKTIQCKTQICITLLLSDTNVYFYNYYEIEIYLRFFIIVSSVQYVIVYNQTVMPRKTMIVLSLHWLLFTE